jgi:lipid-binding SYLF domain-containing protein
MNNQTTRKLMAVILMTSLLVIGSAGTGQAASAVEIEAKVNASLKKFYEEIDAARELAGKSQGMLVFPSVIKAGLLVGGEYGEGALRIDGNTVDYYSTAGASVGFQLGAQSKTVILLFMTEKALTDFRNSEGWEAGVDGSVAVAQFGAGGDLTTETLQQPIIGFVFGNKGLMYNLTLEGTKITKIKK